jgi:transketolase
MTTTASSGHPGGSLSSTDIITALYFHKLRHDPKNPQWPDRDRFVLSKGHGCPALYAALAEAGYFDAAELQRLRKFDSMLQGHPCATKTPGIEVSTGSLGHGLAIANGMALAGKIDNKTYRVYALLGDGECDEGEIWEAAMAAKHYKLDNLVAIVDRNKIQLDGPTETIMSVEPLVDKWKGFGWNVIEIDGHDFGQILGALDKAETAKGRPTVIIANTVKGKGVSFMEGKAEYHGKTATAEQAQVALKELS